MDVPEAENFIEPIPLLLPSRVRLLEDAPKEFIHLLENVLKYKRFPKTMLVEDENSAQERRVTVMEYRYGKELTFVVNPLAKEFLDKITEPFAIMSITGPLRSGKSTFLSHVVNFLRKNEPSGPKIKQNFEVSNKTRCCTVGIWLFPQLLTLSKDGGGDGDGDDEKCKKVLLLDVEGLYGNDSINGKTVDEEGYFLKMFAITSFLSSVVLFNRTINLSLGGNDFQELEKLSAAIKALGDKSEVLIENKPHLVYLARNYNELKSFEDDSKYWSKTLENSRTPKQFRNFFNMKFRKHSFVTFVDMAPLRLENHRDLDQYPLQDLNPDFVKKFTWFMETHLPNILKNLCIKTPDCPEEEIYVSGNFYNLVVRLVQGISDQTEKLDMDEIIRIAKEGEAKREFSKRIKSVLESISSIELPSDWTNKLYPEIETLIFQQASELNMFLEGGGLTTRFSPDQWLADSDIKKKILEVCGNNDMQITQKLSKYWNKQKEEAYQTLEPSSLENWFHVTLLQEDQHLQSLLLPEISKRMQEFHNTKTKEALDLENATYVKIYTTVLSSVKVSIIDIPKTEEGCFTQIRTEPLSYETLDRILSFLKSPPSGPSFGLNAAAEYTSAINQMGSLHKKRIDELMGGFLDNLKICLTERIALMRKDIIDKVSTTLLCPHLMSAFTFKEVYDPDYKNFVVYLKKLVSINSHLNLFVLRRILNEKVATITNNYSTQEIQPISLEELKKFINLVVDTVTGEIPRINQQIRLVWTQDNEKWRKWFSLSNLNIIRESPVELRMADRGTEEELSMPDKPTDRIYILTLDSPETVQRALHPKIVPPRFMKLQRVKSYHVVITNAKQLDPKRLDYIASLPEGTAISEPKYLDDLCLLDFATKKEKFCLLEQGSISVGSEHEYRFLDTYKADCTDDDLKKWEKYLISFTRTENKIRGEFWPVPEVMENPSPVVDEIPEDTPNTLTEKKSVTSSRGTRSDSESSFPINPSVSIIPGEYFRPSYNSIQDLIPEISSNLRTYIWDPICCRVVIQTKKALTEEKEVWRDPYLCSYRILVAATTMVACNLMRYSIVPKEYLQKVLEEDPLAHDKSYDTLAREGKIRETVTVSLPAEKGPTNPIQLFPITTPRISNSTRVTFEQLDTLVCAEMLLSNPSTGRLLVLNMANEHRPGGGWTSGKIAQEEELFRRSNISKILLHSREFYPIPEYSALCSKNVTVFRGVEEEGYAFLEKPFLVDVVSLCAYDANNYVENGRQVSITTTQMNKSRLRRKVVVKTYRKLVTLLHFAIQEGYQTILLGALGCGAFKNPPADIAAIFLEVITQYGGFVPNIVFSILGNVNYDEFKRVFQKEEYPAMMEKPITPEKFDKLCTHGGVCYDLEDEQHASSYFHPPPCPLGKDCPNANDLIHSACNHHPQKCQRGVGCPRLLDENHKRMTIHPPLCKFGIKCKITEENHFLDEWHPPNCEKGLACQEYKDHNLEHITQYRHLAQPCAYGLGCREFHDSNHMQTYCHPFLPLCPKYLCCNDNTPQHRNAHSHVCTWGGSCQELGNENHVLHFYHFMNHDCPAGSKCTRGDELHLNTCSHPKIRDIRPPCKEGPTCPHKNQIDHFKTYSHPPPPLTAVCPINPLIMDLYDPDATIAKAAEEFQFRIPFWDNTQNMLIRFEKYRTSNKIDLDLQSKQFLQIVEWFRDLRPVHRLNKDTFVSVLKTGAFLSIHQLKSLAARDENLVPLVLSHPIIVPLLKKEMKLQDHITNFIRSTIRVSLYEEKEKKKILDPSKIIVLDPQEYKEARQQHIHFRKVLEMGVSAADLDTVISISRDLSISAANVQFGGIGYHVDGRVGTDKTVFSIMGPHNGNYGHIHVVFQSVLKWHPNFYCLPCAATFFYSKNYNCLESRPWVTVNDWEKGGRAELDTSKMHPICPDMAVVLALEYVGRFATKNKRFWSTVRLDDIKSYYGTIDSHHCIEGHLPYQVPLSYVQQIIMSQDIWNSLSQADKTMAEQLLGSAIVLTKGNTESAAETCRLACQPDSDLYLGFSFILQPTRLKGDEVFVPLKLPTSPCRTIYFEALGVDFIVCLCNQEKLDPQRLNFSVCFMRNECIISDEAPIKALSKPDLLVPPATKFNRSLDKMNPIQYYITYDRTDNRIVVGHWGSSEIYSTASPLVFNSKKGLPDLRFLSIAVVGSQQVAFNHFHYKMEPYKSALHTPKQPNVPNGQNGQNGQNDSDLRKPKIIGYVSTAVNNSLNKLTDWTPSLRKQCPDDKICILGYSASNDQSLKHQEEFSHSCLHGSSCTKNDITHRQQFMHVVQLPKCPKDKDCQEKSDPQHRSKFAHTGLWDFMLPCKNGSSCNLKNCDKLRYYH